MVTTALNINFTPGGAPLHINVSQYDIGLREYEFTPYSTPGTIDYSNAFSVTLEATKPDGHAVVHNCTYDSDTHKITYVLGEQLCAVVGRVWSKLVIRDVDENVLGTAAIIWVVDQAGITDDAILSDSDISAVQDFINEFGSINAYRTALDACIDAIGGFNKAATASAMTDHEKVYVYTGNESGYVFGNWYYYNGSAWVSGGQFLGSNSAGLIANVEPAMSATQNYTKDDLLVAMGVLYKATTNIASGTSLTVGTNVVATTIADQLKIKANIDGDYPAMKVGNADQLESTTYVEDKVPYNFRASAGGASIGNREYDTIVGGTVAWNQILSMADSTGNQATITNSNGVYTTTSNGTQPYFGIVLNKAGSPSALYLQAGHKYLYSVNITAISIASLQRIYITEVTPTPSFTAIGQYFGIFTIDASKRIAMNGRTTESSSTSSDYFSVKDFCIFDLTQMFGSTIADYIYSLETSTAGAGVAWFKKLFPKPYYAYNAGELMSVNAASHSTVGFNAWDEQWELGGYNGTTGAKSSSTTRIRCTNPIPVLPNTVYYCKCPNIFYVYEYAKDGSFIGYAGDKKNKTFTTTADTYYLTWATVSDYGTTYKNDICINLSWSGYRNGEYEPYVKHTYALDSSLTLRGIPKLDASNNLYYDGDVYASDGTVTRKYGIVDLGTLTWTYDSTTYIRFHSTSIQSYIKTPSSNNELADWIICAMYDKVKASSVASTDMSIGVANTGTIMIKNTSYTNADAFTTAMSGVYLVYELATPTTETATAYQSPQIVDDFGTEEYVDAGASASTPTRDVAVPVGHTTKYSQNLRDKLQNLPEAAGSNGTYVISQNNGSMTLTPLITPTELPAAPTTNGTYRLIATVSGSTVTYSWTAN